MQQVENIYSLQQLKSLFPEKSFRDYLLPWFKDCICNVWKEGEKDNEHVGWREAKWQAALDEVPGGLHSSKLCDPEKNPLNFPRLSFLFSKWG